MGPSPPEQQEALPARNFATGWPLACAMAIFLLHRSPDFAQIFLRIPAWNRLTNGSFAWYFLPQLGALAVALVTTSEGRRAACRLPSRRLSLE
jgi:hypothetical protein